MLLRGLKERNEQKLALLNGEAKGYSINREGEYVRKLERMDEELKLKVGAPIIALINDPENRFCNGSRGTVLELRDQSVIVEFQNSDHGPVEVKRARQKVFEYSISQGKIEEEEIGAYTQIPLTLGYAMTIHRAQGLTMDSIAVDPRCFAPGQLYTALTRVPGAERIRLVAPISPEHIIVNRKVREFYDRNLYKV